MSSGYEAEIKRLYFSYIHFDYGRELNVNECNYFGHLVCVTPLIKHNESKHNAPFLYPKKRSR